MLPSIAVVSPEEAAYSATFIKAHIDLLTAQVEHMYGVFFPKDSVKKGYQVSENSKVRKIFSKLKLRHTYRGLFLTPQLARYFKEKGIQLAIAEFGPVGAEICDACQASHVPLIVHFHGYDAYLHRQLKEYERLYPRMFSYASYIVVVSHNMRRQLLSLGAPLAKVILNPYGPRDDFFQVIPAFNEINYVAVGRFVHKKAPHATIKAFKKVCKQIPDAKLLMAGDGPLLEACKRQVEQETLTTHVKFLGAISHQQILELYKDGYCFVQHSIVAPNGDSEGTPVAILEAQAAGLPVVATRHAGIPDVVVHGQTGFLVEEHDVISMSNYMLAVAQDINRARQMGQAGRERVKKHFTMDQHIATLNQLIYQAIQ